MFYIKIRFDQSFDAASRTDSTIWSDEGGNGSIWLLRLTDFFQKIFSFGIKRLSPNEILMMTLGSVKISGIHNTTIDITVAFMGG